MCGIGTWKSLPRATTAGGPLAATLRQAALGLLAMAATSASAAPARAAWGLINPSGASVSSYAYGSFLIGCETCSSLPIVLTGQPFQDFGGPGSAFAALSYTGEPDLGASDPSLVDYTLGGGVTMDAEASFDASALRLPVLRAKASADNVQAFLKNTDPPSFAGIDAYAAVASAQTRRLYTWQGTSPATLTFNFVLDGVVEDQRSSLYSSAAFFAPGDYESPLSPMGSAYAQGAPGYGDTPLMQAPTYSVTHTFAPGTSAALQATLSANVVMEYASGVTYADAMHTLLVNSVTGGDLSLLVAAPIPEPTGCLLFATGLGALAASRRRNA